MTRRDASFATGAGALLRRAAPDRARLAPAPVRRRRPRLPRHGQQRRRSSATGTRGCRRGRAAVAAAQHQLPVPLPRRRGVLRAAGRAAARAAGHRLPGQQRHRGRRPGAAAGVGRHRPARRGRRARGLPRLDRRDRRHLHLGGRQPERPGDPAALGAHRRRAQRLSRRVPRRGGAPVRRATRSPTSAHWSRRGSPPAAFLASRSTATPAGWRCPTATSSAVYAAVRETGGLCIADEVQVGYGRLGEHFWGFEQQGVVPDIVTVAKAMGNGHPLGAVITTKAIAEGYRSQGYFFSSAGGSPVSCVVGPDGARRHPRRGSPGERARRRRPPAAAAARPCRPPPIIGAVHGIGLYVGVELVRDRTTLEPATAETAAICERLRELGVIMQPTSDRLCVLKIKPPLGDRHRRRRLLRRHPRPRPDRGLVATCIPRAGG